MYSCVSLAYYAPSIYESSLGFPAVEAGALADRVEQDIVRITASFPHGEPEKAFVLNKVALRSCKRNMSRTHARQDEKDVPKDCALSNETMT